MARSSCCLTNASRAVEPNDHAAAFRRDENGSSKILLLLSAEYLGEYASGPGVRGRGVCLEVASERGDVPKLKDGALCRVWRVDACRPSVEQTSLPFESYPVLDPAGCAHDLCRATLPESDEGRQTKEGDVCRMPFRSMAAVVSPYAPGPGVSAPRPSLESSSEINTFESDGVRQRVALLKAYEGALCRMDGLPSLLCAGGH